MKNYFKFLLVLLSFTSSINAQKEEIKKAYKLLKEGEMEQTVSVLAPVEYLISNAIADEQIPYYYIKGTAHYELSKQELFSNTNLFKSIDSYTDLLQIERENNKAKYSEQVSAALIDIKHTLLQKAIENKSNENYNVAAVMFEKAYSIDKNDTIQLYNAAVCYKEDNEIESALKCFEELKSLNFSDTKLIFLAYSKKTLKNEIFSTIDDRDLAVKNGTHLNPIAEYVTKKGDIYKNIALIFAQKGFKEKAIKNIQYAKVYDPTNSSLVVIEANLLLQTNEIVSFHALVDENMSINPSNTSFLNVIGMMCQNEMYFEGADYYFKKVIEMDKNNIEAYTNLSVLYSEKNRALTERIKNLKVESKDKKEYANLQQEKEFTNKKIALYLQKIVSIDPFNSSVKQILNNLENCQDGTSERLASNE
jgi:tetratricopeptide (TPR) repeat protein